jgi:hypothetical protein
MSKQMKKRRKARDKERKRQKEKKQSFPSIARVYTSILRQTHFSNILPRNNYAGDIIPHFLNNAFKKKSFVMQKRKKSFYAGKNMTIH